MTLRLVTDTPEPIVRRPPPRLTPEQRDRLGAALRNLHRHYGSWAALSANMGFAVNSMHAVLTGRKGSMAMAVRAAELAHIPVERLLAGRLGDANTCPRCGQKLPEVSL